MPEESAEVQGFSLDEYIPRTVKESTHRNLAEKTGAHIQMEDARRATSEMKNRLQETFRGFPDIDIQSTIGQSNSAVHERYSAAVHLIPVDNPIIEPSRPIDVYLNVHTENYSGAIQREILSKYEAGSIPQSFLVIMNGYEKTFNIPSSVAAKLTINFLSASRNNIYNTVQKLMAEKDISEEQAAREAFGMVADRLDEQIQSVYSIMEDRGITPEKAHAQELLNMTRGKNTDIHDRSVRISKTDRDGLVEAYHIQDRPYSEEELQLASRLVQENTYVPTTLITFQELFIRYASGYLQRHPERMDQSLEPFNPIFIPLRDSEGKIIEFAPNPKLLKSMCNNWLPSVAREMIQQQTTDPHALTSEHIQNGIANAENLAIFSSVLGEFNATESDDSFEWKGIFAQSCPAKKMFTDSGRALLPQIFSYLPHVMSQKDTISEVQAA